MALAPSGSLVSHGGFSKAPCTVAAYGGPERGRVGAAVSGGGCGAQEAAGYGWQPALGLARAGSSISALPPGLSVP